jgi:hypothetical protein
MSSPINVKVFNCAKCGLAVNDESFYKDKNGQPVYYHMLNKNEAVMFCSAIHSSDWSLENKEKIWNRKTN